MEEKQTNPVKCQNETCKYNENGICKQFTQEVMFYNKIQCEERK